MRPRHLLIAILFAAFAQAAVAGKQPQNKCVPVELRATDFPLSELTPDAASAMATTLGVEPSEIMVRRLSLSPTSKSTEFQGFKESLVDAVVEMDIDAEPFLTYARQMAKDQTSHTCRLNVDTGEPHAGVQGTDLVVSVPVTVESNVCGSFTTICCKRLKCKKCVTHFRTKLFQKTVAVNLALHPTIDPKIDFEPRTWVSGISGWENEVRKALNQVLEIFTSKMDDSALGVDSISNAPWLSSLRQSVPALVHLSGDEAEESEISALEKQLVLSGFGFYQSDGRVVFRISKSREMRLTAFCPAQRKIRETIAYLDSFRRSTECVRVVKGDSFWKIADKHYANGDCGLALAQLHRRRSRSDQGLKPGNGVLVPPMHALLKPSEGAVVVGKRESRTKILAVAGGSGGVEGTIVEERDKAALDLIYPCQFVSTGDVSTLDSFSDDGACPVDAPTPSPLIKSGDP